ncbi:hypothetical protein Fmac_000948 [Flemingia macrophylla]|uniref:SWIM-type domain-containing protein n=1 Tax=Flemingia macrophylla TaxID=520843 RepID=A0ABD1NFN7_9FABA
MESSGSNSNSPSNHYHHPRFKPSQPISERIVRALRHRLWLLHRAGPTFFIFGATGNVYTVALSSTPSCTCPDRTTPCKHILFVLIRVLGVSLDDVCLRRRTLRPCQVQRLLGNGDAAGGGGGGEAPAEVPRAVLRRRVEEGEDRDGGGCNVPGLPGGNGGGAKRGGVWDMPEHYS